MNKRVIMVTGGGSGIGAAISKTFVESGDTVITVQRSKAKVDGAHFIKCDLSRLNAIAPLIDSVLSQYQRIDCLINNAGIMQQANAEAMSLDDWQRTLDVNLNAPFLLIKHALPHLQASRGNIINISSIESLSANPNHAAYCASKAGLNGLTRAIAVDNGQHGVRCNAVAPGWIATDLNESFIEQQTDPAAFREQLADIHPTGRIGTPQDIANLVFWLASEQAAFVTGQVWTVDGGRMSKLSLP